ncbi:MAG TPA: hypothetical protein PKD00_00660 [Burkholderiales bacterium]|nr:hypothetical protein [Burkholderiales bacterium]
MSNKKKIFDEFRTEMFLAAKTCGVEDSNGIIEDLYIFYDTLGPDVEDGLRFEIESIYKEVLPERGEKPDVHVFTTEDLGKVTFALRLMLSSKKLALLLYEEYIERIKIDSLLNNQQNPELN